MLKLIDLTQTPKRFFDILPLDWRIEIEPFWPEYAADSNIYGLVENNQVIAGGILFSSVSPDTMAYKGIAQKWLNKGYRYIGFLFVKENRRMEGLGSRWIKEIQTLSAEQKYWLTIDDHDLLRFYASLGFQVVQKVEKGDNQEWILVETNG